MRPRLPATETQPFRETMAKRDRRVRIAGRKLWTVTGFAACPETKSQPCFVPRPAPCDISTIHTWRGMARIQSGPLTNTGFTFS